MTPPRVVFGPRTFSALTECGGAGLGVGLGWGEVAGLGGAGLGRAGLEGDLAGLGDGAGAGWGWAGGGGWLLGETVWGRTFSSLK